MDDEPDKGESKQGARQDRLKLALRENLKRRKSQARGRTATPPPVGDNDKPPEQDGME